MSLVAGAPSDAQEKVGDVVGFVNQTYIYHEVTIGSESRKTPITQQIPVHHTDILETGRNGELKIEMEDSEELLTLSRGRLALLDGPGLKRLAKVERGVLRAEGSEQYYALGTDQVSIKRTGTILEVLAELRESRVFVYEGSVAVTSTDSRFPDSVTVNAGEWVRARDGEPVSEPKKFILSDVAVNSGSSECIYSNCRLTDKVLIPPPPVYTPAVLIPPPPNPPGQR